MPYNFNTHTVRMKVKLMLHSKRKYWVGVGYIGTDQLIDNITK
jgi:hypothetical protein